MMNNVHRTPRSVSARAQLRVIALIALLMFTLADTAIAGRKKKSRSQSSPKGGMQVDLAGGGKTAISRVPDLIDLHPGRPEQIVSWTPALVRRRVRFLTNQFVSAAAPDSGRWQIARFVGMPLRFADVAPNDRRAMESMFGLEAGRRYNAAVADLVNQVVEAIDVRLPDAALSVYGLPLEAERTSPGVARLANDAYAPVLARLDAMTSARSFIRMGTGGGARGVRVATVLPETERLRDGRPVLYKMNQVWQVTNDDRAGEIAEADDEVSEDEGPAQHAVDPVPFAVAASPPPDLKIEPAPPAPVRTDRTRTPKPASDTAAADTKDRATAADADEKDSDAPRRASARVRLRRDNSREVVKSAPTVGRYADCNDNEINDRDDIKSGRSEDCNQNGIPDECEKLIDRDHDGVPDCRDDCPEDPAKSEPGHCGCGTPDIDTDGDGWFDCEDDCPTDPEKREPGACGCGVSDVDRDQDGVADCEDQCPDDPDKVLPGLCGCGTPDSAECRGGAILMPGTGFSRAPSLPSAWRQPDGGSGEPRAIARWDVVPGQTFSGIMDIGVVAFHVSGIDRVEMALVGGPWAPIRTMTVNPRTMVREYWGRIDAAQLTDGRVEVRAIAYPHAGEPMALPSLELYVNHAGASLPETFYVGRRGSDQGGDGSEDFPYRTVRRAMIDIAGDLDGLDGAEIVIVDSGAYDIESPRDIENDRWITIRPADDLARWSVVISAGGAELIRPRTRRLRFDGLAFDFSRILQIYKDDGHQHWYDNCRWYQSEGWASATAPYLQPVRNDDFGGLYVTDSTADNTLYGFVGCNLVRHAELNRISGDCFQNSLAVISCRVSEVDGTVLGHGTDLLQYYGHFENVIVYGVEATGLTATRNIAIDWSNTSLQNAAFVNINARHVGDRDGAPDSELNSALTHVLFAHVSSPGQAWALRDDRKGERAFQANAVRFVNCLLEGLQRGAGTGVPEGVMVSHCHLLDGTPIGSEPTSGRSAAARQINGVVIPGLITGEAGSTAAPQRGAWPMLAGVDGSER